MRPSDGVETSTNDLRRWICAWAIFLYCASSVRQFNEQPWEFPASVHLGCIRWAMRCALVSTAWIEWIPKVLQNLPGPQAAVNKEVKEHNRLRVIFDFEFINKNS